MIELRLLGSLSLTNPSREELPAILRQPKRLALLAYLAVATPRGFHRRDTLLALFWPERDTEHARAALSDALYALRRALGDGVILRRGDEEVGLAPDRSWCDAVALLEAVGAGRWEEAVGLYRGEFLAGFHLSGAAEFDRWVEEHRTQVRARITEAGWALADQEAAQGRLSDAARWARRAVALSPYQESGIRRLMALLDRMGERAAALSEYERFAERLSSDLELAPSSETVLLAVSLRAGRSNGGRDVKPPSLRPSVPVVEGPPPALAPPPPDTAQPRSRHRGRVAALVVSVLGLTILGLRLVRPTPPVPSVSPLAIAVLPFSYRGSPPFSYLSEGMVDLLSAKLEGTPGVRPVDSRALLTFAGSKGVDDPRRGDLVARRFGAGLFVLGSVTEAGGRLEVSTTVYEAGARRRSSFEATAGSEAEVFDLADRLARQILVEVQDRPRPLTRVAGQTTTSLPAFKAYLEGEREIRAGRPQTSKEAFHRAVELDTSFALAFYRLAGVAELPEAREAVDRALRYSDRLDEHYRGLILALAALFRGDHAAAYQQYRVILAAHPDDVYAWFVLGWLTMEKGHLLGRAWVDAREPFERDLALEPGGAVPAFWLAAIAAREGRLTDLDSLTNRLLRLDPDSFWVVTARGQRAVALGDTAGENRFMADLRTRPDQWAQQSGGLVTWTTGNLTAGRRLWRLITEPSRSVGFREMAHVTLAKIELTNGRWNAASAELEALAAVDRAAALEHRAYFAMTRFREAPRSELVALRDSLQRWDPSSARTKGDGLIAVHRGLHPYLRLYLLGLLSVRLRDEPAARHYAAELERASSAGPFAADAAWIIRSELAWNRGRPQEALTLLEGARFWTSDPRLDEGDDSPFNAHFHERFARPELLYQLGREDEALPWYRSLAYDVLYTGPAELRQGQIYEHKGDRRRAIEHYSRFLELWRDSDPALQPLVQQARDALARLR
jgi:DNA-binding SARP family transcriptional activator/tetratricopeptide (TPR) repeat protein